jgi:methionine biosynthesis protein MetW
MPIRLDYRMIEEYVEPGARVLDLGCGDGSLLQDLIEHKGVEGCGIDADLEQVRRCIARGVPVFHGDLLEGMAMYADGRFDCVVLSQTLQQTMQPRRVVEEMMRVGRRGIISFPNFAHWSVRLHLLLRGTMPVTRGLPYSWYETPNIHLLTIRDFLHLCRDLELEVVDRKFLTRDWERLRGPLPNLRAGAAVFVIERKA